MGGSDIYHREIKIGGRNVCVRDSFIHWGDVGGCYFVGFFSGLPTEANFCFILDLLLFLHQ